MSEKFKLGDRDFHLSEFRRFLDEQQINESTGGYLWNLLGSIEKEIESIPNLPEEKLKQIKFALDKLERAMKQNLKGIGLKGW